jgi:hypothetical protein
MVYKTDSAGNVIFNVSDGLANFSQRNNEYIDKVTKKTTAFVACNVTSMAMGLTYAGHHIPNKYPGLDQPEDQLIKFCQEDPGAIDYYKSTQPAMYAAWMARAKDCYAPNEVHDVLSHDINAFMGYKATYFGTSVKVSDLMSDIALNGLPIVVSGTFCGFGHVVCLVGFMASKDILGKIAAANAVTDECRGLVKAWIIDDPYGNFHNGYKPVLPGNDIQMSNDEFYSMSKPVNDHYVKFAHRFTKPGVTA